MSMNDYIDQNIAPTDVLEQHKAEEQKIENDKMLHTLRRLSIHKLGFDSPVFDDERYDNFTLRRIYTEIIDSQYAHYEGSYIVSNGEAQSYFLNKGFINFLETADLASVGLDRSIIAELKSVRQKRRIQSKIDIDFIVPFINVFGSIFAAIFGIIGIAITASSDNGLPFLLPAAIILSMLGTRNFSWFLRLVNKFVTKKHKINHYKHSVSYDDVMYGSSKIQEQYEVKFRDVQKVANKKVKLQKVKTVTNLRDVLPAKMSDLIETHEEPANNQPNYKTMN